ncbi:MAG: hypothetical protein BM557_07805 [Flavobacterium sp. MedPE-SWcel]|uniref:hypothetical protein n=1 Tax=uncultured Flavobacterium sp. TaxID=165435 RepID=UPI00091352F6|nr:hypothetical protein [uncultured Flavobacterium sp.]OIQ18112.1 MAG: hypothetical protein BM557_07805 [Flavobacterium sp. MedPE-SWcel]
MKKWKTILALLMMPIAIYFNWGWFWALFILLGLLHVIKSKEIHFVEVVKEKETPILYWVMIVVWTLLALYSILNYLNILM